MKNTFTFTNKWSASVNARRLMKIMGETGHDIRKVDTGEDLLEFYIDGEQFISDWKWNELESWGLSLSGLPHVTVIQATPEKLVFEIDNGSYMLETIETQEELMRTQQMFALSSEAV
jgi:hypothetical protein